MSTTDPYLIGPPSPFDTDGGTQSKQPSGFWNNLLSNAGNILSGTGSLISGIKGNPANVTNNYEQPAKNNTGLYVGMGVLIVVIIAVVFLSRNK